MYPNYEGLDFVLLEIHKLKESYVCKIIKGSKYSYRKGIQLFKVHILNGAEIFQCCRLLTVY